MSREIPEPHENDVLLGRGGKNNQHSGNERLRGMAREQCEKYRISSKKGKSEISRELVRRVRHLSPPGRFLRKTEKDNWEDVGDESAREKASQVLRDAVGQQLGPLANSPAARRKVRKTDGCTTVSAPRHELMDEHVPSTASWPNNNTPSGSATISGFPPYLPVTPVSSSAQSSRKRMRYFSESIYSYEHHSHSPSQIPINSPPNRAYPATTPQSEVNYAAFYPYTRVAPNSAPRNEHASSLERFHFVPPTLPRRNPLTIDENSQPADFDLFNGELLSDHSDRDSPTPFCQSFYRRDSPSHRRDSLC